MLQLILSSSQGVAGQTTSPKKTNAMHLKETLAVVRRSSTVFHSRCTPHGFFHGLPCRCIALPFSIVFHLWFSIHGIPSMVSMVFHLGLVLFFAPTLALLYSRQNRSSMTRCVIRYDVSVVCFASRRGGGCGEAQSQAETVHLGPAART
jgi:hypothetical protein